MRRTWVFAASVMIFSLALSTRLPDGRSAKAQAGGPSMTVPDLGVRAVAEGFITPIGIAFLGAGDMLVLEKNTGQIKRVVNGVVQATVLDLAVNNASERGLLGIALHPDFPSNPGVYLFWTCRSTVPPDDEFA